MMSVSLCASLLLIFLVNEAVSKSLNQIPSLLSGRSNERKKECKSAYNSNTLLSLRGGSSDELSSVDWRYFAAGGICAAVSHGITTPLDVIKTKMQTEPEKYNKGPLNAARDIVASEGAGFLLAGLGPTVVGYGLEGALKFGFYETFKKLLRNLTPSSFVNFLLASVVAGAVASVVLCPMEESRIKMVGEASWQKENLISAMGRLIRENGVLSTFGGLPAMLAKQVPYTMSKQVSFDICGYLLCHGHAVHLIVCCGYEMVHIDRISLLCCCLACIFSQPGDMILTATYKDHANTGFAGIVRNIYNARGLGGFFLGLQARLAHVASIITTQLVLYDAIKLALGLPATGSH